VLFRVPFGRVGGESLVIFVVQLKNGEEEEEGGEALRERRERRTMEKERKKKRVSGDVRKGEE
jgi:hypothetical protein